MDRRIPKTSIRVPITGRRKSDVPFIFSEVEWEKHKRDDSTRFDAIGKSTQMTHDLLVQYIKDDTAWKKDNQPAMDNYKELSVGKKLAGKLLILLAAVGAGIKGFLIIKDTILHK